MSPLLLRAGLRHLLRHPWQAALTAAGVALAVAVVVGIDLANAGAERAFRRGVEGVAGRATHEVTGGPAGLDEALYARLRRSRLAAARHSAPVVEARLGSPAGPLRLLGVDPFAEPAVRDFTVGFGAAETVDVTDLLLASGAAALGRDLAADLGVTAGERFAVVLPDGTTAALTATLVVAPPDERTARTTRDLVVVDVATAQELLDRAGRLDRVDVVADDAAAAELAAWLPPGAVLGTKAARAGALDAMTRAFRLNLTALSLLALVVGMFLIYNAMTFSVVERRPLLGRLRAIGVTRRELFVLVLGEAAVLGAAGTALGLVGGVAIADALLALVVRTIDDLYFALAVRDAEVAPAALVVSAVLGIAGTAAAAVPAAREAAAAPPRAVLLRSAAEGAARRALPRLLAAGATLLAAGCGVAAWPSRSLGLGFLAILLAVVGYALLVPPAADVLARGAARLTRPLGLVARMAARGVAAGLSRTGVATAALAVAIAMTIGVAVMVASFRATVADWLAATLQADLYVSAAAPGSGRGAGGVLDPAVAAAVRALPGVDFVTDTRRVEVPSPAGPVQLHVLGGYRARAFAAFRLQGDDDGVHAAFRAGRGVLVSEPFAWRHGVATGDAVTLGTDAGPRSFPVLGVFTDYATDRGLVLADRALYDRHWRDPAVAALGVFAAPEADVEALAARLRRVAARHDARVVASGELRRLSLAVFDRTFTITGVLRLVAVGVAFLGVLSALMALQLERARERAVLRAEGLLPRQVFALATAESGLSGLVAGILALPLGVLLAAFLVHVVNRRSFGWTLPLEVTPRPLVEALVLAVAAALLAGLYPAWRAARARPAAALREE